MIIRSVVVGRFCWAWSAALAAAPPLAEAAERWAGAGAAGGRGAASEETLRSGVVKLGELAAAQALVESRAINPTMAMILALTSAPPGEQQDVTGGSRPDAVRGPPDMTIKGDRVFRVSDPNDAGAALAGRRRVR
jgi:hypothetical protein